MLGYIPPHDLVGIDLVVLRQAKRKEQILNGVWGRLAFYVEIGEHHGRAIFIEAIDLTKPMRWAKSLNHDAADELERLIHDGHSVTTNKRHHIVSSSIEAVRSTQLYRTLLHEVGHHVDYSRNQIAFDKKISREREVFAHRYADELRERLSQEKVIPFKRILESKILERDGLDMSDFTAI
jgi:ribosomal protein S13